VFTPSYPSTPHLKIPKAFSPENDFGKNFRGKLADVGLRVGMKPKTEIFLHRLMWRMDQMIRPSIRNLDHTFESWAYAHGDLGRIHELEALGFLERHPESDARGACLTMSETAMRIPSAKRHPPSAWKRTWKGVWVQVLFDLDAHDSTTRKKLHRALRQHGFGCLQGSVWIHPFFEASDLFSRDTFPGRPSDLLILESQSRGKHTDRWMVEDAWDWEKLEKVCDEYLDTLSEPPPVFDIKKQLAWVRWERRTWQRILELDPLLPKALWPTDYQGPRLWRTRMKRIRHMEAHLS